MKVNLNDELEKLYHNFFKQMNINSNTGIIEGTTHRFATKMAVGENYENAKSKILFISLDIGKDELFAQNTYQRLADRRATVCEIGNLQNKNAHMAGVYGAALYFLKDQYGWQNSWNILKDSEQQFASILKSQANNLPQDVLSYISLVNFYNFVTVGRDSRTGDKDRNIINDELESQLLINIINVTKPNVIIVQSKTLSNYLKEVIIPHISSNTKIYVTYHPSVIGRLIQYRIPKNYIKDILDNEIKNIVF